jgi:hypothetical protein
VFLVIIGVILVLVGAMTTSIYPMFGNDCFWIGVVLLAVGVISIVLPAIL